MASPRTEALIRGMAKANAEGDTEAYLSFFAEDGIRKYGNSTISGKEALTAFYENVDTAFTNRSFDLVSILVAEDDLAVFEFHEWYTVVEPLRIHLGELPASHTPLEIWGCSVLHLKDGLIKEAHIYSNGGFEMLANSPQVRKVFEGSTPAQQ